MIALSMFIHILEKICFLTNAQTSPRFRSTITTYTGDLSNFGNIDLKYFAPPRLPNYMTPFIAERTVTLY